MKIVKAFLREDLRGSGKNLLDLRKYGKGEEPFW